MNDGAFKSISAQQESSKEKIKYNEHYISQYNGSIAQTAFIMENEATLTPYHETLNSINSLNSTNYGYTMGVIYSSSMTFEEKQDKIKDIAEKEALALGALTSNELNPHTAEMQDLFLVNGEPFYNEHFNAINNATNEAELAAAYNAFYEASGNIVGFVNSTVYPSIAQECLALYQTAGATYIPSWDFFQNAVNNGEELIAKYEALAAAMESENEDLLLQIAELQVQIQDMIQNAQNIKNELDTIQTSASESNTTVSLFAGYRMDLAKHFMLGFEIGADLGNVKIGDNAKKELEIRGGTGYYAMTRMGVNVSRFSVYGQLGLIMRNYDISYRGEFLNEYKAKNIVSAIYGLGIEARVAKNVSVFTEYNHVSSIDNLETNFIKTSLKSDQVKIGSRYYF